MQVNIYKKVFIGSMLAGGSVFGADASVLNTPNIEAVYHIKENDVMVTQVGNEVIAQLKWKDQNGIRVKYDMGKPTAKEKVNDKRKKQAIVEQVTDGLKIDLVLNEKPDTNVFCYQIEGWEDYDFFYQPALTPEEIAEGAQRPEEIVGSYAVYHKTLRNHVIGKTNYENGKFAQIPYPYVWSLNATNTKHRAEAFSIENGNMCVTVAQSDLDTMEYPIRVDPTWGYTTVGASSQSLFNDALGTRYTVPTDYSSLTNYSVYLKTGTNGSLKVVVTDTSRLIITNGVSDAKSTGAIGWQTVSDGSPPTLTPSSDYFFHAIDNNGRGIAYDTGGTSNYGNTDTTNDYTTPFNPSDGTLSNRLYSIYATYTASGGGGTSSIDSGVLIFE